MSRWYRLLCQSVLDTEIGVAPAYQTSIRDDTHTSLTTNLPQCLSGISASIPYIQGPWNSISSPQQNSMDKQQSLQDEDESRPNCDRCWEVETMEHLLCECMHYSQLLWIRLGEVITQYLNSASQNYIPRVEISQLNVFYNFPHPSLLMHIHEKLTRSALLILTQEIKRDIIYGRMNLPPSAGLMANLDSTLWRLQSYSQYIRLAKFGKAISALQTMQDINLELPWTLNIEYGHASFFPPCISFMTTKHKNPIPWQPSQQATALSTQHPTVA